MQPAEEVLQSLEDFPAFRKWWLHKEWIPQRANIIHTLIGNKQLTQAFNKLKNVKSFLDLVQDPPPYRADYLFVPVGEFGTTSSSILDPTQVTGYGEIVFLKLNYEYPTYPMPTMRNASDLRKWILLNPKVRGALIEDKSGFVWKCHFVKPYTSKELFDLRFDRSNVKGDLKEWLYSRIREIYEEADIDDPRFDPLTDDKRKELWHEAALLFRRHKQRATHINHLPGSIDPATLPTIQPDTVNNNILQIMSLYDGPGSKRQRRLAPKK
jgi:hypothetical protein